MTECVIHLPIRFKLRPVMPWLDHGIHAVT
jgi:hypothetical protein